jgi:hypothetical protein
MWCELLKEFTYRYGKTHACARLIPDLGSLPTNIPNKPFTGPTPAMPDEVKIAGNSMASYRNYYINNKTHLASWRGKFNSRPVPSWFQTA